MLLKHGAKAAVVVWLTRRPRKYSLILMNIRVDGFDEILWVVPKSLAFYAPLFCFVFLVVLTEWKIMLVTFNDYFLDKAICTCKIKWNKCCNKIK